MQIGWSVLELSIRQALEGCGGGSAETVEIWVCSLKCKSNSLDQNLVIIEGRGKKVGVQLHTRFHRPCQFNSTKDWALAQITALFIDIKVLELGQVC